MSKNKLSEPISHPLRAVMAALLACAAALPWASALAQDNVGGTQTIAEFLLEGARAAKNAQVSPASPSPLPGGVPSAMSGGMTGGMSSNITPLHAGLPQLSLSSPSAPMHLVGIYGTKGKSVAEFNLDGTVRYLEVDDRITDGWVIARIAANSVDLSRCPDKKPCQKKTLHLEAQ